MAADDSKQSFIGSLQEIDFSELNFDNIGTWPLVLRVGVGVLIFVLVCLGGWYGDLQAQQQALTKAENKELDLRDEFKSKAKDAANLQAYRKQMEEMEEIFGALLSQLPGDTEVPGLLEDISKLAESNGLTLSKIDLKKEKKQDFYVELPIDVSVKGSYHDMGAFISGISGMPRIVTLHDFSISSPKNRQGGELTLNVLAKTYRYRKEGE